MSDTASPPTPGQDPEDSADRGFGDKRPGDPLEAEEGPSTDVSETAERFAGHEGEAPSG